MLRQLLLLSVLSIPLAHANVGDAHGVVLEAQHLFSEPDSVQISTCVDGSKEIPFKTVNSGRCDCSAGTDEPGTGAYLDTTQECCNRPEGCSEVCSAKCIRSEETRGKNQDAEQNIRKKGFEMRSKYIASARSLEDTLKRAVVRSQNAAAGKEQQASHLKHIITIMESTEKMLDLVLGIRGQSAEVSLDPIAKPAPSEDTALVRAREAFKKAQRDAITLKDFAGMYERMLDEQSNTTMYGRDGEWLEVRFSRLTKDIGDYTYQVTLFGKAARISNNGGEILSLGKFASWNPDTDVTEGSSKYYQKQMYTNGTQCWNGVHRSVQLKFECGLENAILSVEEPEECRYVFMCTSPAVCFQSEEDETDKGL
ncbi:hypothetical protein DENSPDRAFT_844535 [Dentipellis sp. KUC8613]|nr:hypothetical protein DENSPDRAFT_844535 [Dentipellis sp. KUC8613]